jgi:hypothetical protein
VLAVKRSRGRRIGGSTCAKTAQHVQYRAQCLCSGGQPHTATPHECTNIALIGASTSKTSPFTHLPLRRSCDAGSHRSHGQQCVQRALTACRACLAPGRRARAPPDVRPVVHVRHARGCAALRHVAKGARLVPPDASVGSAAGATSGDQECCTRCVLRWDDAVQVTSTRIVWLLGWNARSQHTAAQPHIIRHHGRITATSLRSGHGRARLPPVQESARDVGSFDSTGNSNRPRIGPISDWQPAAGAGESWLASWLACGGCSYSAMGR